MSEELLFRVEGSSAVPAKPVTLEEAGLKERDHLQEWVMAHPELIGDSVKVVTFEFARWTLVSPPRSSLIGIPTHIASREGLRRWPPD